MVSYKAVGKGTFSADLVDTDGKAVWAGSYMYQATLQTNTRQTPKDHSLQSAVPRDVDHFTSRGEGKREFFGAYLRLSTIFFCHCQPSSRVNSSCLPRRVRIYH